MRLNRRGNNHNQHHDSLSGNVISSDSLKARIFLLVACIWPLCILALFASSSANQDHPNVVKKTGTQLIKDVNGIVSSSAARFNLRNVLDRVDIMGYGPTHPRVAIIIVAEEKESLVSVVKSVFQNTDLNRIFLICAVVDGHAEDSKLIKELAEIDAGSVPHWHGLRPDIHIGKSSSTTSRQQQDEDDDPHGHKIHVLFNEERQGLASSRIDAAKFIQFLVEKHENAGLKSPQEDLILLLLQSDVQLMNSKWLQPITKALIVPPPLFNKHDSQHVTMKPNNAISFNLEGHGKRTSFNEKLIPVISDATESDMNVSGGTTYPTPALNGAAIALRLETFLNLPSQDESLMDTWPANLELSLNLWLCGDGIQMIQDVDIITFDGADYEESLLSSTLEPEVVARFAAAWMDPKIAQQFFQSYSKTITRLEWETLMAKAREVPTFPKDLHNKCRSFSWYAQEINSDFAKVLDQSIPEEDALNKKEKEDNDKIQKNDNSNNNIPKEVEKVAEVVEEENPIITETKNNDEEKKNKKKPSTPLCKECLEIVQKAKPIDITYVDITNGNKDFPHKGARDENGNWGYIHDEKALKNNPPPFNYPDSQLKDGCDLRDNNWKMLNERVSVDFEYDNKMTKSGVKRDKIFCLVYTISSGHKKIPNIRETWGPKCDGFMVGSNKTDVSIGAVDIPHEGPEEYNNIWQKVRSMWSYIYDNYYEEYDWFHIGGDDLFLIVENLRLYLESEEIRTAANGGIYLPDDDDSTTVQQTPLFLGRRFAYQGDMNDIFNSGGSGYTMNKAALKTLVVEGFPNYFPHAHTFSEDTMVAKVFRKFGVYPYETKDADGGERYMPFLPGHHWGYHMPADHSKDWYAKYSINIKEGAEHCSPHSIAFHYVKGMMMKRLQSLLYDMCPKE